MVVLAERVEFVWGFVGLLVIGNFSSRFFARARLLPSFVRVHGRDVTQSELNIFQIDIVDVVRAVVPTDVHCADALVLLLIPDNIIDPYL